MQRFLALALFVCMYVVAFGQSTSLEFDATSLPEKTKAKALHYWFDDVDGKKKATGTFNGTTTLDVSGLLDGIHTLHFLVVDSDGAVTPTYSSIFMKHTPTNTISRQLKYWFDDNDSTLTEVADMGGISTIDVSALLEGIHTLHYLIVDNDGAVTPTYSSIFMKHTPTNTISRQLKYWFDDNDNTLVEVANTGGISTIDVSDLLEGIHTLHYLIVDNDGAVTPTYSSIFMKHTQTNTTSRQLKYWFDDNDSTLVEVADMGGISTIDVSALLEGIHTLHYLIVDNDGAVTPTYSSIFMKHTPTNTTSQQLKYWFDDNDSTLVEVADMGGISTINVSDLLEGIHTLHYLIVDNDGAVTPTYSSIFMKHSDTKVLAQSLRYWFDDEIEWSEQEIGNGVSTLDVARLLNGLHTLHYQCVAQDGTVTPTSSAIFFKQDDSVEQELAFLRYWFDTDESAYLETETTNGVVTLDVSHVSEGNHTVFCQGYTADGQATPASSATFFRGIYDVYVKTDTLYTRDAIDAESLFAQRPSLKLHYDSEDTAVRGHLTVNDDATLSLGKFVQTENLGSYNNSSKYAKAGVDYYHPTTLVNHGFMRADSVIVKERFYRDKWHFISFPFNVRMTDIRMPEGTYCAIRKYDGEERALGRKDNVWKNLTAKDMMEAQEGYILQLTSEQSDKAVELVFNAINDAKKNAIFTANDVEVSLADYPAEFAHNRSWNLTGNPYPSFYDTRFIDMTGTITVWNGNGYTAYSLQDDHYILMPFESFFVQKPIEADKMLFAAEGRQHTDDVRTLTDNSGIRKAFAATDRKILNLYLSNEEYKDVSRVVLNANALQDYETDKDAVKFMEQQPSTPQVYSVEGGVRYAINERPVLDGIISLSVFIPESGEYTIGLEQADSDAILIDTESGDYIAVNDGEYCFYATAGSHEGRFILALNGSPTSISQIAQTDDGEIRVVDQMLSFSFISQRDVKVYGTDGRRYYHQTAKADQIHLGTGVYIVEVNGKATKIAVK